MSWISYSVGRFSGVHRWPVLGVPRGYGYPHSVPACPGLRIRELPIPTYYGDEICRVNGLLYAFNVLKLVVLARAQDLGIFYKRKFGVTPPDKFANYEPKLTYRGPHTMALEKVRDHSNGLSQSFRNHLTIPAS